MAEITQLQAKEWLDSHTKKDCIIFNQPTDFWINTKKNLEYGIQNIDNPNGEICEFGVRDLRSFSVLRECVQNKLKILHGFDTFTGLPDEWVLGKTYPKGILKAERVPTSTDIEKYYVGLFSNTILDFLNFTKQNISFCHIDSDLYSSCNDVLYGLNDRIVPGTVLVFDELTLFERADRKKWNNLWNGECRSLIEWCENKNRKVEMFSRTDWMQASFKVVK